MLPGLANQNRRPAPDADAFDRANPWIFVGTLDGLRRARARRGSLVAPLDLDPASVVWPVNGLSAVLVLTTDAKADFSARLAGCLVRDGAEVVLVIGTDRGRELGRYQREVIG